MNTTTIMSYINNFKVKELKYVIKISPNSNKCNLSEDRDLFFNEIIKNGICAYKDGSDIVIITKKADKEFGELIESISRESGFKSDHTMLLDGLVVPTNMFNNELTKSIG